jgi:hypothetical protein
VAYHNKFSQKLSEEQPVAPQNSSAPKINDFGFIRISGNGFRACLKFLGEIEGHPMFPLSSQKILF